MKRIAPFALAAIAILASPLAHAAQWADHRAPWSFTFGNELDTHQQTMMKGDGSLQGFLYVTYTGVVTSDGYRVATHADCAATACSAGWLLRGEPGTGQLLYHVEGDHPVFLVERAAIPQPGAYSHFHWLGGHPAAGEVRSGYFLELQAIASFCFVHHDAGMATGASTCAQNGGVAVAPGLDAASHLNIVTSF